MYIYIYVCVCLCVRIGDSNLLGAEEAERAILVSADRKQSRCCPGLHTLRIFHLEHKRKSQPMRVATGKASGLAVARKCYHIEDDEHPQQRYRHQCG